MMSGRREDGASRRPWDSAAAERSQPQPGRAGQAGPRKGPAAEPPVRRYSHPIRTARPCRRSTEEELLVQIQGSLDRQSALLEELLRRSGGNNPDTN